MVVTAGEAEAFRGEPFGVGRVDVLLLEHQQPEVLGPVGLGLSEANGRVLYPAVDAGELGRAAVESVRGVLGESRRPVLRLLADLIPTPPKAEIYFLFQGDGPLELVVQSRRVDKLVVTPRDDPAAHERLLRDWWDEYTSRPRLLELVKSSEYPRQVGNYLQSMLAHRLGLRLPELPRNSSFRDTFARELGPMLGTETARVALQRDRFLGKIAVDEAADQPLPETVAVAELEVPDPPDNVRIEPLATRVPKECLYVRFGSFSNFLWFQDTLAKWRGDLGNLIASKGLNYEVKRRIEQSLVMEISLLARLAGDAMVSDVAIVGTDVFFQEGGSFGLLFHARNNFLLAGQLTRRRQERLKEGGVTEEQVTIAGREVAFLSSSDGMVRSYYATDGNFHFITRSETLVKRFFETGSGKGALGTSKEFRYARSAMPLDRNDTVFVYLSDAFLRGSVGPRYRVETARRIASMADIELVELALLASAAEGKPGDTIEQLIAGGFLPPGFGPRPDGSRTVLQDGEVYDSLRGRRGWFVPVPDIEVDRVTPSEVNAYREFSQLYRSKCERLDPIAIGLKRHALEHDRERVVIDVRVSPFTSGNYQRLRKWLGPPDSKRLAPLPDDCVAFEAVLTDQRLFGGLREIHPPSSDWIDYGFWQGIRDFLVGYVGTTGELGVLSPWNVEITTPADERGYAQGPAGMWRRQYGEFTLFSLQPDVLAVVGPELRFEPAKRSAQIRLRVEDVTRARIAPMLNNIGYARTRQTCLGNLRLMHDLDEQLHVPGDDCKDAAELLLDAKLVCPLGGQYVFQEISEGAGFWTSTALGDQPTGGLFTTEAPEGFLAPPLSWFRGLDAHLTATPEALSIHADLVMQMPAEEVKQGD